MKTDRKSADSHIGIAIARQRNGYGKTADVEFVKALEIDPEHLKARRNSSRLYADGDLRPGNTCCQFFYVDRVSLEQGIHKILPAFSIILVAMVISPHLAQALEGAKGA